MKKQQELQSYHFVWLADHPKRTEEWLRERLREGFHIHHIDGNHQNDDPMNLILIEGRDHMRKIHGLRLHLPMLLEKKRGKKQLPKKLKTILSEPGAKEAYAKYFTGEFEKIKKKYDLGEFDNKKPR